MPCGPGKLAGVDPDFVQFEGSREEALAFVWSENFHRRHLSSSQRAAVAVEMTGYSELLKKQAKDRQQAAGREHGRGQEKLVEKIPQAKREPQTRDKIAEVAGTNPRYRNAIIALREV